MYWKLFTLIALSSTNVFGAKLHLPRATSGYNSTTTSSPPPSTTPPLCCYLDAFDVGQLIWYTSSVEVTVATVSTIVYKYNNTAITSLSTRFVNNTLPTGFIVRENGGTVSGVPTDIIGFGIGGYEAVSTLVTGTVFTDPYGVKYTSPTPVWIYDHVTYRTSEPVRSGSYYVCPTYAVGFGGGNDLVPYPSGYFSVDPDPKYGQNGNGELFTILPSGLKDWLVDHVPPHTNSIWSSIAGCTLGFGDGIPTAHIPVTALTGSATTTTTINGNFGPTTTPMSVIVLPTPTPTPTPAPVSNPVSIPASIPASNPASNPVSNPGESPSIVPTPQPPASSDPPPQSTSAIGVPASSPVVVPGPAQSSSVVIAPGSTAPVQGLTSIPPASSEVAPNPVSAASTSPFPNTATTGFSQVQPNSQVTGTLPSPSNPISPISTPVTPTSTPITTALVITIGGTTIVGNSDSGFVIGSSTLTPGGTVIVGIGESTTSTIVLATSTPAILINGVTRSIQQTTVYVSTPTPAPTQNAQPVTIFTAGGSTFTLNSATQVVIGSSTLTPGGTIVIPASGTASPITIVLPSTGSAVVVNGATQTPQITTLPPSSPGSATTTPILVVGGTTYTANSQGAFVIGSQTLTSGGVITVSPTGTASGGVVTLSLATSGGTLVQASGGVTSSQSVGGVIVSVGGFGTSSTTSTRTQAPAQVTGGGVGRRRSGSVLGMVGGAVLGALVL